MEINEPIKDKIKELYESTSDNITGVMFGKKLVNDEFTNDLSIVFTVKEKLPLNQIPESELLPSSVIIDGVEYKTDVQQSGENLLLACDSNTSSSCYGWQSTPVANQNSIRPLKGGIQIGSAENLGSLGTLGFIALDSGSQAIVGVTNAHVVINNPFSSDSFIPPFSGNNIIDNPVYQPGNFFSTPEAEIIGYTIRYVPLKAEDNISVYNQCDAALIALDPAVVDINESFKQFGLSYTSSMAFATTEEINNLLITNPPLVSSGRTTGAKEGDPCGLAIAGLGYTAFFIDYTPPSQSVKGGGVIEFNDLITFSRINPQCGLSVAGGDSGSCLIANFNGTWKIIGLVFGYNNFNRLGIACRIDNLVSQLGIVAWDGSAKPYINPNSVTFKTVDGPYSSSTLECSGSIYWQIGSEVINSYPC